MDGFSDAESQDVIQYVLSPYDRGRGLPLGEPRTEDDDLPVDSIEPQQMGGLKRGRSQDEEHVHTPDWSRRVGFAAAPADDESPATVASAEETARLLAAVVRLQEELMRQQQLRDQGRTEDASTDGPAALSNNEQQSGTSIRGDSLGAQHVAHAASVSALRSHGSPTAPNASAMLNVLAAARHQLLVSASKSPARVRNNAGAAEDVQMTRDGSNACASVASKKPRATSGVGSISEAPDVSVAVAAGMHQSDVPAAAHPPAASLAQSGSWDDDDALLAACYDALEAAALSQLAAAAATATPAFAAPSAPVYSSTAGASAVAAPNDDIALACAVENLAHAVVAPNVAPARGYARGHDDVTNVAASKVILALRHRLSPSVKGAAEAPQSGNARATGLMCVQGDVELAPPAPRYAEPPAAAGVCGGPMQTKSGGMTLHTGPAAPQAAATAPPAESRSAAEDDDSDFAGFDFSSLDALERALCGPTVLPAAPTVLAAMPPLPPTHLPGVSWSATVDFPKAEIRRLLGEFGRPVSMASAAASSPIARDPAKQLLPAHLRCVVVAVSRMHSAKSYMHVGAAPHLLGPARPAAAALGVAVRQRLWRVAFLRPRGPGDPALPGGIFAGTTHGSVLSGTEEDVVSEALVAVRGQWLECSRVTPGTVVNVVAVQAGRAVAVSDAAPWVAQPTTASDSELRFIALRGNAAHASDVAEEAKRLGLAVSAGTTPPLVIVDDASNAVVLHPDLLLAPTRIASVSLCLRRAVLNETMGDAGSADTFSLVAELGTLKHGLFEAALRMTASADPAIGEPSIQHPAGGLGGEGLRSPTPWVGGAAVALRGYLETVAHDLTYHPAMLMKLASTVRGAVAGVHAFNVPIPTRSRSCRQAPTLKRWRTSRRPSPASSTGWVATQLARPTLQREPARRPWSCGGCAGLRMRSGARSLACAASWTRRLTLTSCGLRFSCTPASRRHGAQRQAAAGRATL